jgi:DNA-binding transcriptional ArsR family regulator
MTTRREREQRRATLRPHPVRDQIVDTMRSYGRPISPTQLARVTGGSLGSVAYHVRTLVAAGVVELADEGRVRGAIEHFYALTIPKEEWVVGDPNESLLSLCGVMTLPDPHGGYPVRVELDDRARRDLTRILDRVQPEVHAIAVAAHARTAP